MTKKYKVALDIGHGINTYPPSKGVGNFAEFTFNNAVGKLAKELLELNGFEVYLPQPFDSKEVDINTRVSYITLEKCDFGISIHANASSNITAEGHEFWWWYDDENNRKLASIMDANAIALLPNKRRGLKQSNYNKDRNFGILRLTKIPFVLAEFGFYTNPKELELLKNRDFQRQCAKVIAKTACDWVGYTFRMKPEDEIHKQLRVEDWKAKPLENLYKLGLITDYQGWLEKIDDPAPAWLIFVLIDRMLQGISDDNGGQ